MKDTTLLHIMLKVAHAFMAPSFFFIYGHSYELVHNSGKSFSFGKGILVLSFSVHIYSWKENQVKKPPFFLPQMVCAVASLALRGETRGVRLSSVALAMACFATFSTGKISVTHTIEENIIMCYLQH